MTWRARRPAPAAGDTESAFSHAVVRDVPDAIVACDPDGRVLLWNPAAERMFGWTAAEVLGRAVPTLPDDEQTALRDEMVRHALDGEHISRTVRRRRRDGEIIDVLADYAPATGADGRLVGTVGVLRDVTDAAAEVRALRARSELIERLHAIVVDLNADLDLPTVLRRITDSGAELLRASGAGYVLLSGDQLRIEAVAGLPVQLVGVQFPYDESALAELVRTGRSSMIDDADRYPNASHEIRRHLHGMHTLAVAQTVVRAELTGALYVFFDDPERSVSRDELDVLELLAGHAGAAIANAEAYSEAIRQREHERAVVDAMADGMAVIDRDGTVREWNPAAEAMTGLVQEVVLGREIPFPVPPASGVPLVHQLPSGRWIEILCTPVTTTGERVVDFRDTTAQKELEGAKDLFLATTSHELRTPITVMKGFAETLLHRWDSLSDAERREAVQIVVQRAETLSSLVEQVLLGTRAGTGALQLSPQPLDVVVAVRSAAAAFADVSAAHTVLLDLPAGLPAAMADRLALDNIVGQLLENALKYSPDGGVIRVSAARDGAEIVLRVSDEGVGISAEHAERIFDRFYQAEAGNRRRFGGVGLGLYIVRELVEAQHGRVGVRPSPRGACFEVRLPVA